MTLTLLKSEEPIDVVSDPEVSGAWAKLMDVRGQIGDAEREIAEISAEITEARVSTTQRAAEALLDGENFEGIVADQLQQKYAAASARHLLVAPEHVPSGFSYWQSAFVAQGGRNGTSTPS